MLVHTWLFQCPAPSTGGISGLVLHFNTTNITFFFLNEKRFGEVGGTGKEVCSSLLRCKLRRGERQLGLSQLVIICSFVPLPRHFAHLGAPIPATSLGNAALALPCQQASTWKTGWPKCKPHYLGQQFTLMLPESRSARSAGFCCFLHYGEGLCHKVEDRPCCKSTALWAFSLLSLYIK